MVDAYKHNPAEINSIVSSLKTQLNNYNEKLAELKGLVTKIETSQSWVDVVLKTSFISACNSYIKIYDSLIVAMEAYIDYLQKKSEAGAAIETTYSAV